MTKAAELKRVLLDEVADKWTIIILAVLCESGGKARFNTIRRETDGISQKTLAQYLRRLERSGIVTRTVLDTAPIGVEYAITPLGHTLETPFRALFEWAEANHSQVLKAQERYDARAKKAALVTA
jgi:DNA-binding HxlR family transcriptional regulator